jgi:hypothetical protein
MIDTAFVLEIHFKHFVSNTRTWLLILWPGKLGPANVTFKRRAQPYCATAVNLHERASSTLTSFLQPKLA